VILRGLGTEAARVDLCGEMVKRYNPLLCEIARREGFG
jgi:hypothetical protein